MCEENPCTCKIDLGFGRPFTACLGCSFLAHKFARRGIFVAFKYAGKIIAVIKSASAGNLRQTQVGFAHEALCIHNAGKVYIVRNL